MGEFKLGDRVSYDIGDGRQGAQGEGFVLGVMNYAPDGSVILVGDEPYLGMPINAGHCRAMSSGHLATARWLRGRYLARFPGTLVSEEST